MNEWWGWAAVARRGKMLYVGAVGVTDEHAHHAVQVLIAAEGALVLSDKQGRSESCKAAVIPANVKHTIVVGSPQAALLFVDPDSSAGQILHETVDDPDDIHSWRRAAAPVVGGFPLARVYGEADLFTVAGWVAERLRLSGPVEPTRAYHPGVRRVLQVLPTLLNGRVRMSDLAEVAGVSVSRLRHLFSAEVGLPFRRYVLWLRVQRVIDEVIAGGSLTSAAHAAGFADSAHLTRVCHRMFGLAPSHLSQGTQWFITDSLW